VFAFLGKYSYGIYLYHMVLFALLGTWISKLWEQAGVSATNYTWPVGLNTVTSNWPVSLTILALTIGISYASYHLLEAPFLRLKKYFTSGKKVS
jgi:peptidoglycan/LPS O-acetylase OafA/YrhL